MGMSTLQRKGSAEGVKPDKQGNNTPLSLRRRKSGSDTTSRIKVVGKKTKTWLKSALASVNAFMTVPMYAALLSIFIAMIPPLQAAMAKLKPVEQAIRSAGSCSSKFCLDSTLFSLIRSPRYTSRPRRLLLHPSSTPIRHQHPPHHPRSSRRLPHPPNPQAPPFRARQPRLSGREPRSLCGGHQPDDHHSVDPLAWGGAAGEV